MSSKATSTQPSRNSKGRWHSRPNATRAYLGYAYAIVGRTRESRQILQELLDLRERQYVSSFGIALIYDGLGEKAAALTALERAFQEHAVEFVHLDFYPRFKTLASEPRYQDVMRHFGPSL